VKILVDTCIWSLALRRSAANLNEAEGRIVELLRELVSEGRAILIGPIRQEILSGVREKRVFERLREHLSAFEEQPIAVEEYEDAARCANRCRAAGIAGGSVDFLICAVALSRKLAILTMDEDFGNFAKVLPITLVGRPPRGQSGAGADTGAREDKA
jgi:hypothetical protein